MATALSECTAYIATVTSVSQDTSSSETFLTVSSSAGTQRAISGSKNTDSEVALTEPTTSLISSRSISNDLLLLNLPPATALSILWEPVLPHVLSTKLALLLPTLILIYNIRGDELPVVIGPKDDIDSVQWIPPCIDPVALTETIAPSAYTNATQLLLFSKSRLHVTLFSLDCDRPLWCIDKPMFGHAVFRGSDYKVWSLVARPLQYDARPVVHHFLNGQSVSAYLLCQSLCFALYSDLYMEWSPLGQWLAILNYRDMVSGYEVQIDGSMPLAHPYIHFRRSDGPSRFRAAWLSLAQNEQAVVVVSIGNKCLVIDYFLTRTGPHVDLRLGWERAYTCVTQCHPLYEISYTREVAIPDKLDKVVAIETASPYMYVLFSCNMVTVLECRSSSETPRVCACIRPTSKITSVFFASAMALLLVCVDHVALFNCDSGHISVVHCASNISRAIIGTGSMAGELAVFANGLCEWVCIDVEEPQLKRGWDAASALEATDTFARKKTLV